MIDRPRLLSSVRAALRRSRVVALIGPRQSGKTTAARWIVPADSPRYFDLEDPTSLARLDEPMTALAPLRGTIVIDEIQRRPELFPILRVLADRKPVGPENLIRRPKTRLTHSIRRESRSVRAGGCPGPDSQAAKRSRLKATSPLQAWSSIASEVPADAV